MSSLLPFVIGVMVGGIIMTMLTSIVQINKINELEKLNTNLINKNIEK